LADFYFLNSELNENCTNLELGVAYCVEAVGNIATYSGYTITETQLFTVPPATFASVDTEIPTPTSNPGFVYTTSLLPTASGTIPGCYAYANYDNSTDGVNDCEDIAYDYAVTTDELVEWNPSLSSNCSFQPGYSYCILQSNTTSSGRFYLSRFVIEIMGC
jgi:hypothetical protein